MAYLLLCLYKNTITDFKLCSENLTQFMIPSYNTLSRGQNCRLKYGKISEIYNGVFVFK